MRHPNPSKEVKKQDTKKMTKKLKELAVLWKFYKPCLISSPGKAVKLKLLLTAVQQIAKKAHENDSVISIEAIFKKLFCIKHRRNDNVARHQVPQPEHLHGG